MFKKRTAKAISPTAHYTGHVWHKNGLSGGHLGTLEGRVMFGALEPFMAASRWVRGPTLEGLLLARHHMIDHFLHQAVRSGKVSQIVEVAAGMSPRGLRFAQTYGDRVHYIEADLPDMAAQKAESLKKSGLGSAHHEVVALDALQDQGPLSLAALAQRMDTQRGTAIITEGLINYFDTATVQGMWQRFARFLDEFPHGLYLSDVHTQPENQGPLVALFLTGLSTFVRGKVHLHFDSTSEAEAALKKAGFAQARLFSPMDRSIDAPWQKEIRDPAARMVHVINAWK